MIKNEKASTLSKARHLGSAKSGTHHWWMQRVTSVALAPLGLWFLYVIAQGPEVLSYDGLVLFLQSPLNAVLMVLFLGVGLYHGNLGLQVVIEDYIHKESSKLITLYGVKFLAVVLMVCATFGIFKMQTGADALASETNVIVNVEQNS